MMVNFFISNHFLVIILFTLFSLQLVLLENQIKLLPFLCKMKTKRYLKRRQFAESVWKFVKKETHSRWNAVAKVPSDFYMKTVRLSGSLQKEIRLAMYVGRRFRTYL